MRSGAPGEIRTPLPPPVELQDCLIPRAGIRLFRYRAGAPPSYRDMAQKAVPCPIAKEIDARQLPATQRVLCALPPAALAEADSHTQIRASESPGQECIFAKRTHLNHLKSAICVSWCQCKRNSYFDVRSKRRGGYELVANKYCSQLRLLSRPKQFTRFRHPQIVRTPQFQFYPSRHTRFMVS